ncbi:MAG: AmmeMemoRadiSam system protein A [Syntrophomonadaceae bacterium]
MITYAALAPHPPLLIPDIGGSRLKEVSPTVEGMKQLAKEVAQSSPDCLVFFTPHGNVFGDCISVLGEKQLDGDLSSFGSRFKVGAANDLALLQKIAGECLDRDIALVILDRDIAENNNLNPDLDHGILVPYYYLIEAGLNDIPVLAISVGFLSDLELYFFGQAIQKAAEQAGRRAAVIASGDMSHRLKNEGPYDFHPDGPLFDRTIQGLLAAADFNGLFQLSDKLRTNAGECGFRSILIMAGCLDGLDVRPQVFSYEGPFGVGYLTAGFKPGGNAPSLLKQLEEKQQNRLKEEKDQASLPVKWACLVLEQYLQDKTIPKLPPEWQELKKYQAGAFVSLKKNGQLRGCIGTIQPVYDNLAEEIAANAVSAGTRDPRFMPVSPTEMDSLSCSVDVLGAAEPCQRQDLNPKRYGVIVTSGQRRGLLLPDLEGVDTVEQQLAIALQKAGIKANEPYAIERFEVKRYH